MFIDAVESVTGLSLTVLLGAVVIYVLAGFVKGTIGIGLPTAGVSLTAQFTDARTAIALAIIPMLITNLWQVWRTRQHTHRAWPFWPLIVTMMISIAVFAFIAPAVAIPAVTLLLGISVFLFALVSLMRQTPELNPRYDQPAQLFAGVTAGVLGGLTGVWAPPIVVYMTAIRANKDTFVAVVGVMLGLGTIVLAISYGTVGLLTKGQAVASAILVLPALLGFSLGERLRSRLNEQAFKKAVLLFFLLMGLNLIRKALV
jgi:uncharacterized protein